MSLDLYFDEPQAGSVRWRLNRHGQESLFESRLLPAELRSHKVELATLQSEDLDHLGDSLGNCFPADLAQLLRAEPVNCWLNGATPWELARVAGRPIAYGHSLARRVARPGEEVTPRPEAVPRSALIGCEGVAGLPRAFRHAEKDFRAVLSSEDYGLVVASGSFEPFRSGARHYVPRLVVLHGTSHEALTKCLLKLGVDAVLATQWEIPWERCAAFVGATFSRMREGDTLGEAVGYARERQRDEFRTDLAMWLYGNALVRENDLIPARLEQANTRMAVVRPAYRLLMLEGPMAGKTIPLFAPGKPLAVGGPGAHDNDIDLEDEEIPCRSFWLEGDQGRLVVSGNVLVNGLPVAGKLPLEGGELLEAGETLIRIESGDRKAKAARKLDSGPLPASARFWLEGSGSRYSLDRAQTLVGRAPDCDLIVEDATVSRRHCLVMRFDGAYTVRKLGRGLTLVNGLLVEAESKLRHGDRLQLGESSEWVFLDAKKGSS